MEAGRASTPPRLFRLVSLMSVLHRTRRLMVILLSKSKELDPIRELDRSRAAAVALVFSLIFTSSCCSAA
jgi:hypothetical protein